MERADLNETKLCELCGKLEDLLLCGGCKEVWYCSRDHQKCDWRKHKPDCKKSRSKIQCDRDTVNSEGDGYLCSTLPYCRNSMRGHN